MLEKRVLKIGKLTSGPWVLGPMAGVTDLAFRVLCKEQGADWIYTEMVSAKGILYHNKNTEQLLTVKEEERPAALQLFGSDPEILAEAARQIEDRNFDLLDINMGCPVPKVVKNGEGSALMKDPALVERIVSALTKAISKPVTVKIRKGFGSGDCNAPEIARAAEAGGAAAVAVHGRTREQYYSGQADWRIISEVKRAVSIPVIGNGDVQGPEDAVRMLRETGCDGVMVARGARGNPWIFRQLKAYEETGVLLPRPEYRQAAEMILRHAQLLMELKGEMTGIREMRKHAAWYTAGYPGASRLRGRLNLVESYEQLQELLEEYGRDFA